MGTQHGFRCLGLSPASFTASGAAIAVARAGGVGVVDLEFCRDLDRARDAVNHLVGNTTGHIGLRIAGLAAEWRDSLLGIFGDRPHTLIVRAGDDLAELIRSSPRRHHRRFLVELTDVSELSKLAGAEIDGLIARGHEAGGWVGADSSYILLQKLLKEQARPVYVQGGVGVRGATACRAGGAAGVVLDDQLLLMPDSAMPEKLQKRLSACRGADARVVGERLGRSCRVLARPGFSAAARLQELADAVDSGGEGAGEWVGQAETLLGWDMPEQTAWPVGQAIEFAADLRDRYKTAGRLVQAIQQQSEASIETVRKLQPLAPDAPFAGSHGLRYPIAQGPMTRVSDSAKFAHAVAEAGGLPFLALALMSGDQVAALLAETKALLGGCPWGVGLLGFVPKELRDRQVEAIWKVKPPVALIAGGRPDQAAEFEKQGIATYIHVPSAELLRMFIDQGARRFVFEGRECGGHVGPLGSLVLWETQIRVLLEKISRADSSQVHVLFAGGVNDALSAAMVAAMAAPLAERGMRIGVLMGSAYLFTQEIVSSGAIVREFQAQALACEHTINVESGPGHATRCAVTPFADEFYAERRRLKRSGASADEIRERLEEMNLGRLRMASKGKRRDGAEVVDIDVATQVKDGMYMIGQVATLLDKTTTVAELHRDVSEGSVRVLEEAARGLPSQAPKPEPSDIAIIGIGTLLPRAPSPEAYWHNIVNKVNAITEVPGERWDWRLYFDQDRRKRDKVYSKWGGFLDEVAFDPTRFGIPPNSLRYIDPMQLLTLEVVRRALEDAGYADGDFDRENTSVILGAGGGLGDLGIQYAVRSEIPRVIEQTDDRAWDRLPEWSEESFPGSLLNVAAGRVANRFDFGGLNFTVDAACASGLAAIDLAVSELEAGRSSLAIAGGIDTVQSPFTFLCFSKTQALSPEGKAKTFDANGDGIVISEGLAVMVLKRLKDAERDGDRIYAVIKAVAGSSDGKALGLTAPLPAGQMRALDRAYGKAGFSPRTLGLIEAHGTGTAVGDRAEIETVVRTLEAADTPARSCAVGSVKTIVGHTKATAGAAGMIKVALSLYHRTLPPHVGVSKPLDAISAAESPVYLVEDARPWFGHPDHPRRAGVSAFGFGGTNFHAVVEEYCSEYRSSAARLSGGEWPCELFVFRGTDKAAVAKQVQILRDAFKAGAQPRLRDLAYSLARQSAAQTSGIVAATIVAADLKQLSDEADRLLVALAADKQTTLPPYVQLATTAAYRDTPIAFLFPGQGTQYPNMAREATLYLEPLRAALEQADRRLRDQLPQLLTQYAYPPAAFGDAEKAAAQDRLTDTRVAQPAIGAVAAGFLDLVTSLGLRPSMTAGHSYGEFAALHAGGVLSREDFLDLSGARGRVMADACNAPERGAMAAVRADRGKVESGLKDVRDVIVANHNSPEQVVISGPEAAVKDAVARLKEQGLDARLLPVAGAFHSRLMAPVQAALAGAIEAAAVQPATAAVYSNTTGQPYPIEIDAIRRLLTDHLLKPVEFVRQIERMHADGARVFVELGPKAVLSGLVGQILSGRDHLSVALDSGGGMRGLLSALGALYAGGVHLDLERLYDHRDVEELNLNRLAELCRPEPISPNAWFVSGGCARPQKESLRKTGKIAALTMETAEVARRAKIAPPPQAASNGHLPPPAAGNGVQVPAPAPIVPLAASTPQAPVGPVPMAAASSGPGVEALLAYQETMRQFIALQEQVMARFLSGTPSLPTNGHAAIPVTAPQAFVAPEPVKMSPAPAPEARPVESAPAKAETAQGTTASLRRDQLVALLLEQVSERTGYPPELLGLGQDIEAELGIDSIKRVEILGALQERLPAGMVAGIKDQMETLTRVKTLDGIVDRLLASAGQGASAPAPAVATAASPQSVQVATNDAMPRRDELRALLLEQVSERTGYPPELLRFDQDIEAELGIDSIKRVEILGALQERLPASIVARVKEQMETLTREKTLDGVLDRLLEQAEQGVPPTLETKPPPVASESVAAKSIDRKEFQALLISQVSERTGYPAEILGLEQDIEAELGIDSIKRVEILGALQERLPAPLVARIKEQMETLTRVKTLNGILDRLLNGLDKAVAAAPPDVQQVEALAAVAPARVASVPCGPDRGELTRMLIEQVSERTGYPPDMLGMDQDIEAELGIDSIKRVEILGALQERLPAAVVDRVKEQMETLTRVKTLSGIVERLVAPVETAPTPAAPVATAAAPKPAEASSGEGLPRFRMQAFHEPLPATGTVALAGLFLVTEDELGVASRLTRGLTERGATARLVARSLLADPAGLEVRVKELRAAHGPVHGIVHLAPLSHRTMPAELEEWRSTAAVEVKSLYRLLHVCAEELMGAAAEGSGWLVGASALGGSYGRDGRGGGNPVVGAVTALIKTARMEWPGLAARHLDVDPAMAADDIVSWLLDEFRLADGHVEVGVVDGRRTAFRTASAPFNAATAGVSSPDADWVLLVTGGARGITAEIACETIRPGMTCIVVGRTPVAPVESADTAGLADPAALRRHFLAQPGAAPMTPAAIERAVQKVLAEREIRRNLARLAAAGAKVVYHSADVRDERSMSALLDEVYAAHGRLDGVIHGAGIIDDKLIVHKTPDSFDRVFDTKVDSAFILGRHLRADSLKLFVLFSSVSGRYGNRGQSDYAAANDAMNRLAWSLRSRWPTTRVLSINWGPWNASGMVTEDVKRQFAKRGVTAIEPTAGRRYFADELRLGQRDDVEIVAGAGPWHAESQQSAVVRPVTRVATPTTAGPVLIAPPTMLGDGTVSVEHSFEVTTHPFLNDHRLDNVPVLPAAAAMEWMAQLVQAGWPDMVVHELTDVRVLKGFRLDSEPKRAVFKARASSHADAGGLKVAATFGDPATGQLYYKAAVTLLPRAAAPVEPAVDLLASGEPVDTRRAYNQFLFHGPCFQLLTSIDRLGSGGGDASVLASEPRRWLNGQLQKPGGQSFFWLFDPGLLDAAFQLALVWARTFQDTTALPGHLGAIVRYGDGAIDGPLQLRLRITPRTNEMRVVFDATFIDRDGKVRLTMSDMECPSSRALNRLGGTA